ncbi:T9SS type A sorting domain-containing protein [Gracilimonas sediminicola]|uniref:T9SS type A sorting domain-containing protein n=1 Tax=Gracilimonas sediminicola TaxID=2952158 RepID=A0A9X2RCR6_9BACT|nr:T9SS type A sorting domain-containing protein [Gracilimonas sediminicola]MCP9290936.1 T9SS type A sorting domain-containing protein [Gracilimonas sediminicola]
MKSCLQSILIIVISFTFSTLQAQTKSQIDLPITFEEDSVDYTLLDFGDASTVLGQSPTDTANTVAVTTKPAGSATWAGTTMSTSDGLATVIPFTEENTKMSMLVYAPSSGIPVRLKAEDHTDNTLTVETEAVTTIQGWQKLVFDFSNVAPGTNPYNPDTNFDMLSIFFNFGTEGTGKVYYWDDVMFGEGAPSPDVTLSELKVDGDLITGFSPATTSYTVQLDSGTTIVPEVTALPTDTNAIIEITPAEQIPGTTTILVTGADEFTRSVYTVKFSLPEPSYPPLSLPVDFEEGPYNFIDFDGGIGNVVSNPEPSGINTSEKVARLIKGEGLPWAGSKLILEEKLDFTSNNSFSMKVFSPRADVPVLLKIEGPNGAEPDNIVHTTKANEWETLVWNYPDAESGDYDALVFMFDFGTIGDGSANFTFLFDDIVHFYDPEAKSQIDLPVTFQSETVDYEVTDFGGNDTEIVPDPEDSENTVGKTTKTAGSESWAGTTVGTDLGFKSRIPFTAENTKMNVRLYSPSSGIPVRLKVEDHNDPTLTAETEALTTKVNGWETLEFDFSTVAEGTNPFNPNTYFDKLSIFFNFNVSGTGEVYYWDDVEFGGIVTSSEDDKHGTLPDKTELIGSYPNPFNPTASIQYRVKSPQRIEISVFTITGQKVGTIFSGYQAAGSHVMQWNASQYASGVYFVRLVSGSEVSTIKLLLQK